ncbi:unnamed protein product [Knipowitschia caucasica]|uniref:Receptor protein-tyrosine kinase n=1 Tax=Knipowitschia caucasica TaxID=637954 RepID=A0AAV2L5K9_KNICA
MERVSRGKSAAAAAVMLLLFGGVSSKVCLGSSNQLNQLGTQQNHYENLRKTFENCTSVLKNLEITHTQAQHNLSFLQSIEEVGGYVLIAMNEAVTVPLSQLRLIRGQSLYEGNFSLLVMANFNPNFPKSGDYRSGMRELLLSNLTEIMNGGVKIINNPFLCHIDSIQWWDILDQSSKPHMVLIPEDHPKIDCPRCDPSCVNGTCWAPGPQHCQKFTRLLCADQCSHRCRGPSPGDCCHEHCAAGCTGPLASQCLACRLFNDDGTCQRSCPRPVIYDVITRELVPNPQAKFTFGPTCVKACPRNYVVTDWACVRSCPPGKHEVLENEVHRCKDSDSLSPKACDGIGVGALVNTLGVNSTNIELFRNCTKVIGDIIFIPSSFNGDHHYNVSALDPSKLEVFQTLREITGFLLIQFWPENFTSLSVFENLQIIRGRTLHRDYSLVVMGARGLRWLGLRSLREISHGKVILRDNPGLCYTGPNQWEILFETKEQSITYKSNGKPEFCLALNSSCDPMCSSDGCWGPGPTLCVSCLYLNRGGRCVQSCYVLEGEPREVELDGHCVQCHSECKVQEGAFTCSGPGPDQCSLCAHAQDGAVCVGQCPQGVSLLGTQLWKYEDEEHQCQSCHINCTKGCNGPSMSDCIGESRSPVMAAVIVGSLLAIVLVALVVFVLLRRRRITRKRTLRRILQERELVEPLTPSGQAPNQALLRILKETEIRKVRVLGSGAFGTVYKGLWFPEGEQVKIRVAIKVLREATSPKANQEILDEAYVMASVDHPHVSRLLGVCLTSAVQLVTQLMPYGALLDYVRHHQHLVGAQRILNWCVQIAKGMSYLEDRHLVHRDLAARNVLVKSPNHVKITDFGLAKLLTANESEYHADGGKVPIKWMALESILQSTYTHQSDVWSYGVTVWELMTFGSRPYDGISAPEICSVLERGERLPQPPICTIDVYMIMVKCWMINPSSRPRFWELVRDFSEMARDPQRFLVIQGQLPSPSDSRFFSRLLSTDDEVDAEEYLMPYREGGAGLGCGQGSVATATNGAVRRGNDMALRYIADPTVREEEEDHEYMNQTVDQADVGACGSDVFNPNYEDLTLKWTGSGVASALEEPGSAEYLNTPRIQQRLPAISAELPEYMNPDWDQGGPDYANSDYVNSGDRSSSTVTHNALFLPAAENLEYMALAPVR